MLVARNSVKPHSNLADKKSSSRSNAPNKATDHSNQLWRTLAVGTQTSSSLVQRKTDNLSEAGSAAQPMGLFENTMCPDKVEFVGIINNNDHYRVYSGINRCNVYVEFDSAEDEDAVRMSQLLQDASNGKRDVCIAFEMMLSDPNCDEPREVFSVT